MSGKKIIAMVFGMLLAVTAQAAEPVVSHGMAKLNDTPAIQFATSGWDYANITNPFLLTPDVLTNAMVGVSRLKPGEPFLQNGPPIPTRLTPKTIKAVLAKRLKGKSGLKIKTEKIGGREVAVATYTDGDKKGEEYAFAMHGYLVHVLLLANHGSYFKQGEHVARKVVETIKPL